MTHGVGIHSPNRSWPLRWLVLVALGGFSCCLLAPSLKAQEGKMRTSLGGFIAAVNSVAITSDGKTLATGGGGTDQQGKALPGQLKMWNLENNQEIANLQGHKEMVNAVAFTHDGKILASGSQDKTIRLWDTDMAKELAVLKGHTGAVNSLVFTKDGKTLISGSYDRTIKIWDVEKRKELKTLKAEPDAIWAIALTPDEKTIAAATYGDVKLWYMSTGKPKAPLKGHTDWVFSVAISPDGKLLASGSGDKTVRLWSLKTGKAVLILKDFSGPVTSLAFSSDSKTVVCATGEHNKPAEVKLFDTTTGKVRAEFKGHALPVHATALSVDGSLLATGSQDRTVRLWDVPAANKEEK
jgi:WD40 repeat protein